MEDELARIAREQTEPLQRMTLALRYIRKALSRIFDHLDKHPFPDQKDEIHFFKVVKPQFYGPYLFEIMRYHLVTGAPVGDEEQLRAYYLDELRFIQRDLRQHTFLYQYYRLGARELDELYFVRGVSVQSVLIPEVPELDQNFATSGDYLFSKFSAYEMLQEYIAQALANIGKPERSVYIRPGRNRKPLKWTGELINSVELGYGIWLSGQLNEGDASLADIIYWLSESLDIDLSKHTGRFEEIKNRKILSQTHFIDRMRDTLRKYISDLNGFQPLRKRKANRVGPRSGEE
ncbi:RteC domain-containing protein [Mucilaginibacter koreensis]